MLFNFGNKPKPYSSKKGPTNYMKHLYHQQSFSEIADDHVNSNSYLFEASNELSDIELPSKNDYNHKKSND